MPDSFKIDHLRRLATAFRKAVEESKDSFPELLEGKLASFPKDACGHASTLLALYLQQKGVRDVQFVYNGCLESDQSKPHPWLEIGSIIVDITADQFPGITETIIVTEDHSWHFEALRSNTGARSPAFQRGTREMERDLQASIRRDWEAAPNGLALPLQPSNPRPPGAVGEMHSHIARRESRATAPAAQHSPPRAATLGLRVPPRSPGSEPKEDFHSPCRSADLRSTQQARNQRCSPPRRTCMDSSTGIVLSRRDWMVLAGIGIFGIRLYGANTDFWNKKDPSEWTEDEIQLLLTRSPRDAKP